MARRHVVGLMVSVGLCLSIAAKVNAHCDTENGPVAVAARTALKTGAFDGIVIWVGEAQQKELHARFDEARTVYGMGGQAKKLAERYFMETAVRLHREAEGMTYTGLKPARPLPPDIAKAEETLETGNLKPLTDLLTRQMQEATEKWFHEARQAKRAYDGRDVEAGRRWVDNYVKYVIYVHGLYETIQAGPAHGVGG